MSQPTTYVRAFNFTNQQAVTPSDPLRADKVDLEYNLIKTSLDETQANLALIQRDDGAVANQTIGYDQLKAELDGFGFNPPTAWLTATNYIERDTVFQGAGFYRCAESHISGVFATDLAAGKWVLIADFTASTTAAAASAAAALVSQNAAAASASAASTSATTATTQAGNAATSATAAAGSATTATTQAGIATADVVLTHADVVLTHADVVLTHADAVSTAADRIAAAASAASVAPLATQIHAATSKTTPVDADELGLADSAASFGLKKLTWANLKAAIWTFINGNYVTPWVAYTPTFVGAGTVTGLKCRSRRNGPNLEVEASWQNGTVTAVDFSMSLGFNGANGSGTCAAYWDGYRPVLGSAGWNIDGASFLGVLGLGSSNLVNIGINATSRNILTPVTGTTLGTGTAMSVRFSVPIEGWN